MSRQDDTSIWKKEITFRRKPKGAAPPAPAAEGEPSIWKKEISLRRKPKAPAVAAAPATGGEPSIWKKEISFRRKPKQASAPEPAPASPPAPGAAEAAPVAQHQVVPVSPPPAAATPAAAAPAAPEPTVTPDQPFAFEPQGSPAAAPAPAHEPMGSDLPPVTPQVVPAAPAPSTTPVLLPPTDAPAQPEADTAILAPPSVPAPSSVPASPSITDTPAPLAEPSARKSERATRRQPDADSRKGRRSHKVHKRVVGLKIGASQVAAAEVVNTGRRKVVRMARAPLPRGVVVGGELRDTDELTKALKAFFRKNRLGRTGVRLGVSSNRIGVRSFEISGIEDEQQLANAVRFRAQEVLPIPLDEAVLDYRILDDRVDASGTRVRRVLLVVAHRDLVERYAAACRNAGLKLVGIDLEAFALLRALSDPADPPADDAAVVCITIGHDRSTLAVSDGQVCEFTRVLGWGGSALDVALARALDLTPTRAEAVKFELSFQGDGQAAGLDAARADEARRAMAAELQAFAREIIASLRFYQEQPGSLGIAEIRITGGTAACGGLVPELEQLIGVPVRIADPLQRVQVPARVRKRVTGTPGSLAVAVGLGIED